MEARGPVWLVVLFVAAISCGGPEAGDEPERAGSAFDALYADDGYHPTAPGTYLAACVIAGTIIGRDPITFADPDESLALDPETAYGMRLVARATLADPEWTPR